jgi:hypothetical protein
MIRLESHPETGESIAIKASQTIMMMHACLGENSCQPRIKTSLGRGHMPEECGGQFKHLHELSLKTPRSEFIAKEKGKIMNSHDGF